MKFEIEGTLKENIYNLMRRTGYFFLRKTVKSELEFVRPPKGFPRFHLFLKIKDQKYIFNLHLDQKAPIYKGAPAHAGEYNGKVVEEEAERIKKIIEGSLK
ncbi:hypothetical protein J7J39_00050 [bacterium]|nr:hypothetical protein [bacterium]